MLEDVPEDARNVLLPARDPPEGADDTLSENESVVVMYETSDNQEEPEEGGRMTPFPRSSLVWE